MNEPSLGAVRDLLIPALWEVGSHPELEVDIQIDTKADCLIIKGWHTEKKKALGFAITRARINDGSYKETFKPSLLKLAELLLSDWGVGI